MPNNEDMVLEFKHKPTYAHVSLRTVKGEYVFPQGGFICMKIEVVPECFGRRTLNNFQEVFTLETLQQMIEANSGSSDDPSMIMTNMYKKVFKYPLNFVHNVRPFGITASASKASSPMALRTPVIIDGMLSSNYEDESLDDTLKINARMLVLGDERSSLGEQVRLNVYLTVDNSFVIRLVLTKYFSFKKWLLETPQGQKFKGKSSYIAWIKIGHTHDRRSDKTVLCQNNKGYWCVENFIFSPGIDWTIYNICSTSQFTRFFSDHFGGNFRKMMTFKLDSNWINDLFDMIKLKSYINHKTEKQKQNYEIFNGFNSPVYTVLEDVESTVSV